MPFIFPVINYDSVVIPCYFPLLFQSQNAQGIRQITRQITSNCVEPWGPNQGTQGSACPIWRGFLRSSLLSLWKCQLGIIRCDFSTDARNVEFHMQSLILNVATNSFFFFKQTHYETNLQQAALSPWLLACLERRGNLRSSLNLSSETSSKPWGITGFLQT